MPTNTKPIERKVVDIVYLSKDWGIVAKEDAYMVKIFYDDDSIVFAYPLNDEVWDKDDGT